MSANPAANQTRAGPADESQAEATLHEQAARALEASEVRYRRLFETAKDGILILDGDSGEIIDPTRS